MKQLLSVILAALFAAASVTAIAQEKKADKPKAEMKKDAPKKELTAAQKARQERMKECNAQANEKKLKGDERKKFVSACAKPPAKAKKGDAKPMKAEPKK
jgi:Ni/Co efflux regulator RcnB